MIRSRTNQAKMIACAFVLKIKYSSDVKAKLQIRRYPISGDSSRGLMLPLQTSEYLATAKMTGYK